MSAVQAHIALLAHGQQCLGPLISTAPMQADNSVFESLAKESAAKWYSGAIEAMLFVAGIIDSALKLLGSYS